MEIKKKIIIAVIVIIVVLAAIAIVSILAQTPALISNDGKQTPIENIKI